MTDTLRPQFFCDFVGQEALKYRLQVHIDASLCNNETLEPVLLAGSPGFGKTSLGSLIAKALGAEMETLTMPVKQNTLFSLVRSFSGVVLLDEIHRAPQKGLQEDLLNLLEFGFVQTSSGTRIFSTDLAIVGATTEPENLIPPLYDRFIIKPVFEDYTDEEMMRIVLGMARMAEITIDPDMAERFGRAAGGTPRNARQLILAYRDLQVTGKEPTTEDVFTLVGVDENGLTTMHHRYLDKLSMLGGKAGLNSISTALRLHAGSVMELERLLLKQQYITYGSTGRELLRRPKKKVGANV